METCENGCSRKAKAHGLCQQCYLAKKLAGRAAAGDFCSYDGCDRPRFSTNGLCRPHYRQIAEGGATTLKAVRVYETRVELPDGTVRCRICHQAKPREAFRVSGTQCTKCYGLARRYGLTPDQFQELLDNQGGGCAICGTAEPGGRWNNWAVDHDHGCCTGARTCGKCVKGALCNNCNMGIGFFRHDPATLTRASSYAASTRAR